jgi:hypothetical protein
MRNTSIWSKDIRKALRESEELQEYVEQFLLNEDSTVRKGEIKRLARLIVNVELGLTLLKDIAPSEPAIAVSALLSGYRFPVPSLQNDDNWRKVRIARFYLSYLKGQAWERSLDEYIRLPKELKIFELASVNEIPESDYTTIFPNRLNSLYSPALTQSLPHSLQKVKQATVGLWYAKISVKGNSPEEVPIYIPQAVADLEINNSISIVGLLNVGKSTLLQILIYHLAKQGYRCALIVDNVASQVRLASLFWFGLGIPAAPILGSDHAEHLQKVYEPILLDRGEDIDRGGIHPAWRWFSPVCPLLAISLVSILYLYLFL